MEENMLTEVLITSPNNDAYKEQSSSGCCVKFLIGLSLFATICFTFLTVIYVVNKPYADGTLRNIYDQQISNLTILSCVNNFVTFSIYFFLVYKNKE